MRSVSGVLFALIVLFPGISCAQDVIPLDFLTTIGAPGDSLGQFRKPNAIAIDVNGNIYVADAGNHRVQWLSQNGTFQRYFGGIGSGKEQFDHPTDVCAPDGLNIFVTDMNNHRLHQLDRKLNTVMLITGQGWPEEFMFRFPVSAAVSPQGDLFIAEQDRNSVLKVNPFLTPLNRFGNMESGGGILKKPTRLELVKDEYLFVADSDAGRIAVYDYFGNFLEFLGEGVFGQPSGLCYWPEREGVLVTDPGRRKVWFVTLDNTVLPCKPLRSVGKGEWISPIDLAIYDKKLFILDQEREQILVYRILKTSR